LLGYKCNFCSRIGAGNLGDHISGTAIAQCNGEVLIIGVGKLKVIGVLRFEVWISFLISIGIQVKNKRVKVIILRAVDAAAVGEVDLVFIIYGVTYE
jgi:hypothetical protein